jgi:hypothetical protein
MEELSTFLLFNSRDESNTNGPRFYFPSLLHSVQKCSFQQPCHGLKIVTSKPLTICGHVNDHWKPEKVLFDFGIQLMVRFPLGQYQFCDF